MSGQNSSPLRSIKLALLMLLILAIGYLDFSLGFGFNLFPLYLIPVAIVAWTETFPATAVMSLSAAISLILKIFLTKEYYTHKIFWSWDSGVKVSLLLLFSYGLWRIRQLTLQKQQQDAARINELNASLKVQVEQLTAANRELTEVSYTISHDLRAPLRHIIGFAALLNSRSGSVLDDQSKHYLQVITEATQRMGDLIDGLLAFSQLGRTELVRTEVDLNQTAREVVRLLSKEIKERDIEWKLATLPPVVGDAAMLRQVLHNLISNALKFTRRCPQARIEIGSSDNGNETLFYVRDNGAGFDMRYVGKLFGLFQRLHAAEEYEGTGIGLAIVRRIVSRHGGRTWAEGTVAAGATFWFSLPKS